MAVSRLRDRQLRALFGAIGAAVLSAWAVGACASAGAIPAPPTTEPAAAPTLVEPSSEPTSEPAPLVEISAEAMVRPAPIDEQREPAPFDRATSSPGFDADQLARILAVQDIVVAAAAAHEVEPALINGLIWVESKFEPRARGPAGAQGLMQLMPKTAGGMAKLLGRKRASYDPDFNIHAGTLLLARLLRRFDGDVSLALAAYNRGSGIVAGWVAEGEPLPERTQAFVDRVLAARAWFVEPLPVLESAAIASN